MKTIGIMALMLLCAAQASAFFGLKLPPEAEEKGYALADNGSRITTPIYYLEAGDILNLTFSANRDAKKGSFTKLQWSNSSLSIETNLGETGIFLHRGSSITMKFWQDGALKEEATYTPAEKRVVYYDEGGKKKAMRVQMYTTGTQSAPAEPSEAKQEAIPAGTTQLYAPYAMVAALLKAEDIIGKNRQWQPIRKELDSANARAKQEEFLKEIFLPARGDAKLLQDVIESIASHKAEEINRFLAKRGFDIKLRPFTQKTDFGVASVLDILVTWQKKGHSITLMAKDGKRYPAAEMSKETTCAYKASSHPEPVICLLTGGNEKAYMTKHAPLSGMPLVKRAMQLSKEFAELEKYDKVIFPKAHADVRVDIGWMLGMGTECTDMPLPAVVAEALKQVKLRLNEKGAHAEAAVAIGLSRGVERTKSYTIDEPYLFWMERGGCKLPIVAGYISQDSWKEPGEL